MIRGDYINICKTLDLKTIRNNPELLKRIENTSEQDRAKLLNELRANYKGGIPNIKEHAAEYNEWRNALLNANRY